jgi:hypothetical protein
MTSLKSSSSPEIYEHPVSSDSVRKRTIRLRCRRWMSAHQLNGGLRTVKCAVSVGAACCLLNMRRTTFNPFCRCRRNCSSSITPGYIESPFTRRLHGLLQLWPAEENATDLWRTVVRLGVVHWRPIIKRQTDVAFQMPARVKMPFAQRLDRMYHAGISVVG